MAGGPFTAIALPLPQPINLDTGGEFETGRTMRVVSTDASPRSRVAVSIEMDTQRDEVAASFTLNFDPAKLSNPIVALGSGAPAGTALTTNANDAANGNLGVLVDSSEAFSARQVVTITFDVAPNAKGGSTPVSFTDTLAARGTSDAKGNRLATHYEDGAINITGPDASGFNVSGRVLTPDGHGLRNARVTMTDQNDVTRTVTTSSFGYYQFDDAESGRTYIISVASRSYRFAPQVLQVFDTLSDVDFVGLE